MPYRYYVKGWSGRLCMWIGEAIECRSKQQARDMFKAINPTLRKVQVLLEQEPLAQQEQLIRENYDVRNS